MARAAVTLAYLAVAGTLAFATTFVLVRWLISSLAGTTLVGVDIHKRHRPRVPEMGGIAVVTGFYVGVTFLSLTAADSAATPFYSASLLAILGAAFVGILDDLFAIRKLTKALLPFILAVPLGILLYLQGSTIVLGVDVGVLSILLIPFGLTSAANTANMLEGFNGLGAGLGIIMSSGLILLSLILHATEGLYLLVPLLGALVAFMWFNRYPSRIFPGDSMTLMVGAALGCAAVISSPSFRLYGLILFLPMITEFLLKARGRFEAENYGEVVDDGRLVHSGRVESIAHVLMRRGKFKEWQVVAILWGMETALVAAVLLGAILLSGG